MNPRRMLSVVMFAAIAIAVFWIRSSKQNSVLPTTPADPLPAGSADTRTLSQQMTDRLLGLLCAETDPSKREAIAQQAVKNLPRALLPSVLANLEKENDRALAAEAARAILLHWAWEEPTGAAAWTLQFAAGEIRRDALAAVGAGWARQNPEALMAWTSSLAPGERDWVLLHGASYIARTDLGLFAVWLKALPPTRELEQLTAQTARSWAARDPQAIAAAIGEFTGPEHAAWRKSMAAGLASQLAQVDRCDTAFTILDAVPPGPEKQLVLKGVVIGWSQREPALVATWLDGVSNSSLRTEMSTLLAGAWFEHDAAAAEKWATNLSPGPVSDAVAERAAQYYAPRDRAVAVRWINRIISLEVRSLAQADLRAAQPLQPNP